jgi:hypothetical protein
MKKNMTDRVDSMYFGDGRYIKFCWGASWQATTCKTEKGMIETKLRWVSVEQILWKAGTVLGSLALEKDRVDT